MKKVWTAAAGLLIGLLNGLFGAGGGMAAVPALRALKVEPRKSHATSILVISALSVVTICLYLYRGNFALSDAVIYLPGGLAGAVVGALLLKKLPLKWIRLIFGIIVLVAAGRLFFR